jgi:hypothetical protein
VPTLKRYVANHCEDPEFRGLYEQSCEVCRVTVELVARLDGLGLPPEEIAARSGVTVRDLTDLREADRCSYAAVVSLCAYLGVPPPAGCRRKPS